jgi:hypothetical protein
MILLALISVFTVIAVPNPVPRASSYVVLIELEERLDMSDLEYRPSFIEKF